MSSASLLAHLARTQRLPELLPPLHEYALQATGGSCSLLFEFSPRDGGWHATSGFGLDELGPEPWTPDEDRRRLIESMFKQRMPLLITDSGGELPELLRRLGAPATLLIPLALGERWIGLLAVGFGVLPAPDAEWSEAVTIGDAFTAAIEYTRLRQKEELEIDLAALLDQFGAALESTLSATSGFEVFCRGARQLFAADRASIWIHDRSEHDLVLQASSDPPYVARGARVSTEDVTAPAVLGMRRTRAEMTPTGGDVPTNTVTVPLRGRRRALGTVVFEGIRVEPGHMLDLLDRADAVGRHLSHEIENLQLLDDVIRSRRATL